MEAKSKRLQLPDAGRTAGKNRIKTIPDCVNAQVTSLYFHHHVTVAKEGLCIALKEGVAQMLCMLVWCLEQVRCEADVVMSPS